MPLRQHEGPGLHLGHSSLAPVIPFSLLWGRGLGMRIIHITWHLNPNQDLLQALNQDMGRKPWRRCWSGQIHPAAVSLSTPGLAVCVGGGFLRGLEHSIQLSPGALTLDPFMNTVRLFPGGRFPLMFQFRNDWLSSPAWNFNSLKPTPTSSGLNHIIAPATGLLRPVWVQRRKR